jgi:hypothetical protein
MKFDAARANAIFEKLGDPVFTAPQSDGRVADYVAHELEGMGWNVERREVEGSRFPQRAGPWIGWLGYGALITTGYLLSLRNGLLSVALALVLFFLTFQWLEAVLSNRIRPGRRRMPLETAPLLIGSLVAEHSDAVRVVFQAVLGGLKTDFFQSLRPSRSWIVSVSNACFWFLIIIVSLPSSHDRRYPWFIIHSIITILFVLLWITLLCILTWEHQHSGPKTELGLVERRGLAVLLELARSWRHSRPRQIESIFVAAGGQRLNYAGSREVLRILESENPAKPTLLVLFFAPGAGKAIRIAENDPLTSDLSALAKDAAESLWVPSWGDDRRALCPFWPFAKTKAAEPIALIGSDPMAFFDDSVSPEALHRAAQLATEIALRWAKKQRIQAAAAVSSSSKPESLN